MHDYVPGTPPLYKKLMTREAKLPVCMAGDFGGGFQARLVPTAPHLLKTQHKCLIMLTVDWQLYWVS